MRFRDVMVGIVFFASLLGCATYSSNAPPATQYFGKVANGTLVKGRVEIQNREAEPIRIASTSTSCGCVSSVFGDSLIHAGESGWVHFEWKVTGIPGALVRKSISVRVEDPSETRTFSIEATISSARAPIFLPAKLNLGCLRKGELVTREVAVRVPRSPSPAFPREVNIDFGEDKTLQRFTVDEGDGPEAFLAIEIQLAVPMNAEKGSYSSKCVLVGTDLDDTPVFMAELPMEYSVGVQIQVSPPEIAVFDYSDTVNASVLLKGDNSTPEISDVMGVADCDWEYALFPHKNTTKLTLVLRSMASGMDQSNELVVKTNLGTVRIPIRKFTNP